MHVRAKLPVSSTHRRRFRNALCKTKNMFSFQIKYVHTKQTNTQIYQHSAGAVTNTILSQIRKQNASALVRSTRERPMGHRQFGWYANKRSCSAAMLYTVATHLWPDACQPFGILHTKNKRTHAFSTLRIYIPLMQTLGKCFFLYFPNRTRNCFFFARVPSLFDTHTHTEFKPDDDRRPSRAPMPTKTRRWWNVMVRGW